MGAGTSGAVQNPRSARACAGRLALLGFDDVPIGTPIDWHCNPVTGPCAPRVRWSRIDALDAPRPGDSTFIWEFNRHQWVVYLGEAYKVTGDDRYAAAWTQAVQSWLVANLPEIGSNGASSLEPAYRLISWSWSPSGEIVTVDTHALRLERPGRPCGLTL